MSRISFLVGFDRIAQSAPADIAGAAEPDTNAKRQCRRELGKKNEEQLAEFWEETRLGLVRRMRCVPPTRTTQYATTIHRCDENTRGGAIVL